ncbi:unnamed protein product [Schistocephalus solidus]|uniref:Secreted protein n=1 Tax=Schistocephalus solidus TaxID=70667 RepID=A0A183TKX6_SCHSO|nr:unnamed protein product [Schistocephalus solidus]
MLVETLTEVVMLVLFFCVLGGVGGGGVGGGVGDGRSVGGDGVRDGGGGRGISIAPSWTWSSYAYCESMLSMFIYTIGPSRWVNALTK